MKTPAIFLLAAAPLLTGCGLYSRYERPQLDVDTDSLFRENVRLAADTLAADTAAIPWRQLFADPQLQALIATGLERNADLAIARLQVEEAQASLRSARLSYLPSASLAPQAGISHYNGETKKTYSLGATAAWEVDIFGRLTNAKREAAAALEQSHAYRQAVQTQLVATIAEAYYTLLMLDEQIAIAQATLGNWDETVSTLQALVEAGRANDVAVRQAVASRTALQANLLSLRQSVSQTENSLCALLKQPAAPISRAALADQRIVADPDAGIPLRLLSARPDVRQAEAAMAQAFYATNSARAAFYPTLTLSGTLGWTNNGGGSILNPGAWLSSAVAQLTAPLFQRGTLTANLQIARARQQEATLSFEQTLLQAANEVNDALTAWQTADQRIRLDREQVAQLEAATEKTRLLVQHTSANYLEVLTAQQSLLSAQLTLAQDRAARLQSTVSLYHALGGGAE